MPDLNSTPPEQGLIERLSDEADLCRNDGADDIANLLITAAERIKVVEATQLNLVRRGEHFRNAGIEKAAALIEELSKRPSTQWGEIVKEIRALKEVEREDD